MLGAERFLRLRYVDTRTGANANTDWLDREKTVIYLTDL